MPVTGLIALTVMDPMVPKSGTRPDRRARVASRQGREVGPARTHDFFTTSVVNVPMMALLIVSTIVML